MVWNVVQASGSTFSRIARHSRRTDSASAQAPTSSRATPRPGELSGQLPAPGRQPGAGLGGDLAGEGDDLLATTLLDVGARATR